MSERDELADVPTDVLGSWVTDQGRCVWEVSTGKAPERTGDAGADGQAADRLCAGCPMRMECAEFERRVTDAGTDVGASRTEVWQSVHAKDRDILQEVWATRNAVMADDGEPDDGEPVAMSASRLAQMRQAVTDTRRGLADVVAAARCTIAASGEGETDPLWYLRDEIDHGQWHRTLYGANSGDGVGAASGVAGVVAEGGERA